MTHILSTKKPRILFLFSDTGGGHRSAAEAIIEAIHLDYPDRYSTEMVDFFKEYAPPPLDLAPQLYPSMAKLPGLWKMGYQLSDNHWRAQFLCDLAWPYIRHQSLRLSSDHPFDLLVSVHPIPVIPYSRILYSSSSPFVTVVTDLVSTHALWFDQRTDLVLVPTDTACQHGLEYGLRAEQIKVVGLPVAERFCQPIENRFLTRARLGWPNNLPIILLMAGGDGMGSIEKIALTISKAHLNAGLAIITGRNQKLKNKLENVTWPIPTFIYGFVKDMPDFMRCADILLTKAGPGTISVTFVQSASESL